MSAGLSSRQAFAATLEQLGVALPVDLGPHDTATGSIVDAAGQEIMIVDVDRGLSARQTIAIAAMVVLAINTCGGHATGIVDA